MPLPQGRADQSQVLRLLVPNLQAMNTELEQQEDVLNRVTDHVDKTNLGLEDVQQSAEKTLGKKGGTPASLLSPHICNAHVA